jgi:hypothetical protein
MIHHAPITMTDVEHYRRAEHVANMRAAKAVRVNRRWGRKSG